MGEPKEPDEAERWRPQQPSGQILAAVQQLQIPKRSNR
jgi:hypothetical protein